MELLKAIAIMALSAGWLALAVVWFVLFMGMHNNTKSGNSFRLLNPFILFLPSEFTEKGNKYRKAMLWLYLFGVAFGVVFNYAYKNI